MVITRVFTSDNFVTLEIMTTYFVFIHCISYLTIPDISEQNCMLDDSFQEFYVINLMHVLSVQADCSIQPTKLKSTSPIAYTEANPNCLTKRTLGL